MNNIVKQQKKSGLSMPKLKAGLTWFVLYTELKRAVCLLILQKGFL